MEAAVTSVIKFLTDKKLLYIDTRSVQCATIELTILNELAEPVNKMKLISGAHSIDLSGLLPQVYLVKLVAGNNVWMQKISIQ